MTLIGDLCLDFQSFNFENKENNFTDAGRSHTN